jgi:hypothetical protein
MPDARLHVLKNIGWNGFIPVAQTRPAVCFGLLPEERASHTGAG